VGHFHGIYDSRGNHFESTTAVVFILLTITFFVLAIGAFSSQAGLTVLGGYLGLLTAIGAWYVSAITVIASTRKAVR
jgi:Predicted membrane protein